MSRHAHRRHPEPTKPKNPFVSVADMRVLFVVLLFALPGVAAQAPGVEDADTDGQPFQLDDGPTLERIEAFADDVTGQAVHDCVAEITQDPGTAYRMMGTPTQDMFVEKHKDVFADMGLPSDLHHFDRGSGVFGVGGTAFGEGGTNIVGVLPGQDPTRWVVMGGHFDTREGTIGALDNASGICTVKEIARAMKADTDANGPYEASVVFNWYDGEEWGLYGAIAFAEDHTVAKELLGLDADAEVDIMVSQSYDMPGINYPALNNWVRYGEPVDPEAFAVLHLRTAPIHAEDEWRCWSYGCYEDLKSRPDFDHILFNNTNYQFLVREAAYDLLSYPPDFVQVHDDHYGRSDHIPLIARGAAGMRIQGSHDEQYPCYHQPCDTLPWLYTQTGGQDRLIQAYDAEASIGSTAAMYTALRGDVGLYGVEWLKSTNSTLLDAVAFGDAKQERLQGAPDDAEAPVGSVVLLALAALALAYVRRR